MRVGRPVIIFALVAGWVAALAVTLGGLIEPRSAPRGEVDEVIQRLQDTFIGAGDLSAEELRKAAIEGIIDSLDDPYTSYLSPEQYERFVGSLEGGDSQFEGIGAEVTARGGQIMILWPLPGSPARGLVAVTSPLFWEMTAIVGHLTVWALVYPLLGKSSLKTNQG